MFWHYSRSYEGICRNDKGLVLALVLYIVLVYQKEYLRLPNGIPSTVVGPLDLTRVFFQELVQQVLLFRR